MSTNGSAWAGAALPPSRTIPVTTALTAARLMIALLSRLRVEQGHLRLGVGELVLDEAVLDLQDVEPPPARRPTLGLEATDPADERLAGGGVHEEVLGLEAHLAEVAAELWLECRANGRFAAADRPGELLVDGVLGHQGQHALEIVLVERLGEAHDEVGKRCAIHRAVLYHGGHGRALLPDRRAADDPR